MFGVRAIPRERDTLGDALGTRVRQRVDPTAVCTAWASLWSCFSAHRYLRGLQGGDRF